MLVPMLVLASFLFFIGVFVAARISGTKTFFLLIISLLIAAPGLVFAAYYLKIFNEPIWLYRWRSIPFSELSASGVGFLMGVLQTNPIRPSLLKLTVFDGAKNWFQIGS